MDRYRKLGSFAGLLCLGIAGCSILEKPAMKLDELIRRQTAARGGREAIEAIHNLEVKLRIVEPTYTADGVWRVDRKGRMRIDVFMAEKRVFTEAFDGKRGWQMSGGGEPAKEAGADGTAALRRSSQFPTNILGLHEMEGHGHRLEYAGREEVDGVSYHVVVLTLDDGLATRYYIDPRSFLIARARVHKALHPDIDPTPTTIETVWTDVRDVAGVRFAYQASETDLVAGKLLQTTTLLEVTPNAPLDDSLFLMPGSDASAVSLPQDLARVLRDYERAWQARDAGALANLFAEDGFVLADRRPPVRGRGAIREAYAGAGGPLWLRPLAHATEGGVGYIIGQYGHVPGGPATGKFVVALRRQGTGPWLIAADIDNSSRHE